jgi:hypothetical protein
MRISGNLILLLFFTLNLFAQSFTEVPELETTLPGLVRGDVVYADVDGDGDLDILVSGQLVSNIPSTKLFLNEGGMQFSEDTKNDLADFYDGSAAFGDVDGDGDMDLILAGTNIPFDPVSILYLNNGNGLFSEVEGTPFEGCAKGEVKLGDFDGDNDLDLVMAGAKEWTIGNTKMYKNDGTGNFTEELNAGFQDLFESGIEVADIDGDNDLDLLVLGLDSSFHLKVLLYTNDGNGNFSEVSNSIFNTPYIILRIELADVNGDNFPDAMVLETDENRTYIATNLYLNNGSGIFDKVPNTDFATISDGRFSFGDVDGDNDQDVVICGDVIDFSDPPVSKLYLNDGTGNFSAFNNTSFRGVTSPKILIDDFDNDTDMDIILFGNTENFLGRVARIYVNNQLSSSTSNLFKTPTALKLFPNPASSTELQLSFSNSIAGPVQILLWDRKGQLIQQIETTATAGPNTFELDISTLAKGTYIIEMNGSKDRGVSKFTKT